MTATPDAAEIAGWPTKAQRDDWCDCPLHTMFPQRISDLIEPTLNDLKAACALIGKDTYGKPHWTPQTIHPHNSVVQAFARHALTARSDLPSPAPASGGR